MEFLKSILGDGYGAFETAVNTYNADPANKDKQVKIGNLGTGEYVAKNKYTALETEKNNLSTQLAEVNTTLKGFEGVDVKELQGKITTLSNDMVAKETTYKQQIADMEFNSKLESSLKDAKNAKSVIALLDLDNLKASKNQDADIEAAVKACKEENDYLFGATEPINNPVGATGGGGAPRADANTLALRAAMGLGEEKK